MRRLEKKFEKPRKPWDKERIEREREILKKFGLKRKKELWRVEWILRKYRRMARSLIRKKEIEKEKVLIEKLKKLGVLKGGSSVEDVLSLSVEDVLERRLQTLVFRKGLANSIKHARQLITHGHIKINGRKIRYPSYLVPLEEEDKIEVEPRVKK